MDSDTTPSKENIPGSLEQLSEMLGEPVNISGVAEEKDSNKLDALSFELYKETVTFVKLVSHLLDDASNAKGGLSRNKAICSGLLIRIAKFMSVVLQLTANTERLEVVEVLNRCILESSTNLAFLVIKNDGKYYDQFVEYSLGPERELYDTIQSNIEKRGGQVLPIETRMLESIDRCCRTSNFKIIDINRKPREWGEGMRERLKTIGMGEHYAAMQRIPSHAIHGTWVDLLMNNLEYEDKKNVFTPNPAWGKVDERVLGPIAQLVLNATEAYLEHFFADIPEIPLLVERLNDLRYRLYDVGKRHEEIIQT